MATKTTQKPEGLQGLLEGVRDTEQSALDAAHRFAGNVNDSFPDLGDEGEGPRKSIIDGAFKMTGEIIDAGHRFANNVIDLAESALHGGDKADGEKKVTSATG